MVGTLEKTRNSARSFREKLSSYTAYTAQQSEVRGYHVLLFLSRTMLVREAKEALGPNGNLEKDQLNRVTIVNFIRWFQRREQRRVKEEARLRDPLPPWKVHLEAWRKV